MNLSSYQERSKFIRRLIFWVVIIGAFLAMLFIQTQTSPSIQVDAFNDVCDTVGGCIGGIDRVDSGGEGVTNFVLDIAYFLIYLSAAVAVVFIVLGGYNMMISQGDSEKYGNGLKTVQYAVIGLVVAIVSVTIVNMVSGITQGDFLG